MSEVLPLRVGRYELIAAIASGGMATVYLGRMHAGSFMRTVAIKRVHRQYAHDPDFSAMFFDEVRLTMRIRHPNVVPSFDVVEEGDELLLVMEYVHGESLSRLLRTVSDAGQRVPLPVVSSVIGGMLDGLQAAHEARGEDGRPLGLVHRDVSPQNVLVGIDGISRVVDFGVAKAAGNVHASTHGEVKGKLAYAAPEQLVGKSIDRRTDVFAAGIVLWEGIVGRRLFARDTPAATVTAVLSAEIAAPSTFVPGLPRALDEVVLRALSRRPEARFASARDMAVALERAIAPATTREVGSWVESVAGKTLDSRNEVLSRVEKEPSLDVPLEVHEQEATLSASATETSATGDGQSALHRGRRIAAAGVGVAVGVSIAFIAVLSFGPTAPGALSAAPSAAPASPVVVAASSAAPATVDAGDTAASPPPTTPAALPSAAAREPVARPHVGSGHRAVAKPGAPATAPRSSAAAAPDRRKPDCTDPFIVDSRGIQIPRPECF